jgi:trimeric autotransporter adhesin
MKLNLLLGFFLLSYCTTWGQGMAVNNDGSTADASALLDVKSTTKGMLIPRMTKPGPTVPAFIITAAASGYG